MNEHPSSSPVIRPARISDIPFIIETIFQAERSGTAVVPTCRIFNITEEKYKEIIHELLLENISGYEYSLDSYLIAFIDNRPAAAFGAWIEGYEGVPSSVIKLNAFYTFIEQDSRETVINRIKDLSGRFFAREQGTLQFEYAYVPPEFKGKGVLQQVMREQIRRYYSIDQNLSKAQVALFKENLPAYKSYLRFGFQIAESKIVDGEAASFFPLKEKILMECTGDDFRRYLIT